MTNIYSHFPQPKSQIYLSHYIELIDYVLSHPNTSGYTEKHHILPRAMFPCFIKEKWNLIVLTAEQHYKAHYFLWKAFRSKETVYAFWSMRHTRNNKILSENDYASLKANNSAFRSSSIKGKNNPMFGKFGEQNPNFGLKRSEEFKLNQRNRVSGKNSYFYGKSGILNPAYGIKRPKYSCLQCKHQYAISIKRHFNSKNCQSLKPE